MRQVYRLWLLPDSFGIFLEFDQGGDAAQTQSNISSSGRGRDGSYLPPPAQIRTCGTTAYGSCLGYVTRSDPQGKDVHF